MDFREYHKSVSEFDLNLFEQTTNANQTTSYQQCPEAQKLAVAHIKERLKKVGKLVAKANNYQEQLLEEEKQKLEWKQEVEQTRELLRAKNEEYKVMCDEQSIYVNQLAEQAEEIIKLKEKLKSYEKLDYDIKLKDKIINGYSEQMKALQNELEGEVNDKKQKLKDASMELKHAKANKAMLEKKLVRLLKEYVVPTTKKRDRWLESTIKKYSIELIQEEDELEETKVEKSGETDEKQDETGLEDEVLLHTSDTQPTLHRNISLDFDNVGSVDTGRGSSLGLSDGEKSVFSPDYYTGDSPPSVVSNILCNKCNIPQSDGSTSPMSPERSGFADNSATNNCKRCDSLSKKDACTSPIPSQSLDTASNTSDDIFDIGSPRKGATSNIEQTHINIGKISQIIHTPHKKECESGYNEISPEHTGVPNKELFTSLKKIQDFANDSDEDDDFVSVGSGVASPVEELNKSSPINFDKVIINSQIIFSEEAPTAAAMSQDDKGLDVNDSHDNLENVRNQCYVGESSITSPCGIEAVSTIQSKKEALSISMKLHDDTGSNTDNDVVMHNMSPNIKSRMFSPIDFDDTASNCTNIENIEPHTTPTKLQNKLLDLNINRSTQQELECLELNNSNNCSNDEINNEVKIILDKMRLRHGLITPIPGTPTRSKIRPPENPNRMFGQQAKLAVDTMNEQINLLRTKVQEVFTPFVESMPQYLGQIVRLVSDGDLNEELIRNLLGNPDRNKENFSFHENEHKLSSYNAHAESICKRQPDVIDLNMGSMLCITEINENEDSTYDDSIAIDRDFEVEDQITSTESNNTPDVVYALNKEPSHCEKDIEMSNALLLEVEQSHVVGCLNSKVIAENSFINNDTGQNAHEVTHGLFEKNFECDNNTQVSVVNSNTTSSLSAIESRKSIVYEGIDMSDDENDIPISELFNENLDKTHYKRKDKSKKKSKLNALRMKMLPKSKIKKDDTKSIRTPKSKLIPINTVPKKKTTISDTAASLNDKAVYENAVKVLTRLRSAKVPKIIIEDCALQSPDQFKADSKNIDKNKDDNSSKPQSPKPQSSKLQSPVAKKNNKRKLSESLPCVPEKYTDSGKPANISETKKGKRTGTLLDEDFSDKSPKKIKQKANDISHQKRSFITADAEILSPKRAHEAVHTSDYSETKIPKRKRSSVSDCQTQTCSSKSNDNIEPHSPRVLRSSTLVKNTKACVFKETPIVVQTRQKLRSKEDTNEPETCDNTSIVISGRKPRIARQKTHSGSEGTQVNLHNSSPRSKRDQNEPETCGDISVHSSDRMTRITRQKAHSSSENTQVELHSFPRSKRDQNKPETCDNSSIITSGRMPRITGLKSNSGSESTQVDLHNSSRSKESQNEPETCVNTSSFTSGRNPRIARQKSHSGSENTQVDLHNSSRSKESQNEPETCVDTTSFTSGRNPRIARLKSNSGSESTQVDLHNSSRSKESQNEPETCVETSSFTSGRKPRIARQNSHSGSENTQVALHRSPRSKVDQNSPETCTDVSSLTSGRKPRIARQKSHSGSEDTQVALHRSPRSKEDQNNPETCTDVSSLTSGRKPRIARQKSHSGSENTLVALHSSPLSDTSINNSDHKTNEVSYADLNMFSNDDCQEQIKTSDQYRKDSLLCLNIQKYGVKRIKFIAKQAPERKVNEVWQKLEKSLSEILEVPHELCPGAMKELVAEIRTWKQKHFILGFIKFLKDPERKIELFNKSICPPFPPMTKKEQVLLFVLDELQKSCDYRNIVQKILMNIEYTLLALNKSAESFEVIETMSHFYAILCRGYQKISQLRMFIIDAMYCLQLKSVILVQQCLDVWMAVLPLGHMGLAKCPLVTCLVYLLHFYKCEDRYNRVQGIRNTLRWKYNYDLTDWNENMILDIFRTAIIEIRDSSMERKTLRLSLLILAKRHGAKWCHTNIVKNMLQPLISDSSTTERAKRFCLSVLGPLLKPYPVNMKVHYAMVIDYLMEMLDRKNTPKMQEAIISSLIYVDKDNHRLHQFLARWTPKQVSAEFDLVFRDYVRSKPVHVWKKILSWKL